MQPDNSSDDSRVMVTMVGLTVLGIIVAVLAGISFSEETWSSFLGPGLVFGLAGIAAYRRHHFSGIMIFIGGGAWMVNVINKPESSVLMIAASSTILLALLYWAVENRIHSQTHTDETGE